MFDQRERGLVSSKNILEKCLLGSAVSALLMWFPWSMSSVRDYISYSIPSLLFCCFVQSSQTVQSGHRDIERES